MGRRVGPNATPPPLSQPTCAPAMGYDGLPGARKPGAYAGCMSAASLPTHPPAISPLAVVCRLAGDTCTAGAATGSASMGLGQRHLTPGLAPISWLWQPRECLQPGDFPGLACRGGSSVVCSPDSLSPRCPNRGHRHPISPPPPQCTELNCTGSACRGWPQCPRVALPIAILGCAVAHPAREKKAISDRVSRAPPPLRMLVVGLIVLL